MFFGIMDSPEVGANHESFPAGKYSSTQSVTGLQDYSVQNPSLRAGARVRNVNVRERKSTLPTLL